MRRLEGAVHRRSNSLDNRQRARRQVGLCLAQHVSANVRVSLLQKARVGGGPRLPRSLVVRHFDAKNFEVTPRSFSELPNVGGHLAVPPASYQLVVAGLLAAHAAAARLSGEIQQGR